ncbi:MAG: hypothetical protein EON58_03600 [Alphaproteobacteria bacterium]|nr:MAG: hypothetical protein EON58_03600 [Alphaproteobacteria bacterium]
MLHQRACRKGAEVDWEETELIDQLPNRPIAASEVEPGSTITALHVCVDPAKIGGSVEEVDMQEMRIRDEGTAFQLKAVPYT